MFIVALITSLTFTSLSIANPDVVVYVDPPLSSAPPGATFDIYVTAGTEGEPVSNLFLTQFSLSWDPLLLDTDADSINLGDVSPFLDMIYIEQVNNTEGWLTVTVGRLPLVKTGLSGVVQLAKITFLVEAEGSSDLHLFDTRLKDTSGADLLHTTIDGYFSNAVTYDLTIAVDGVGGTTDPAPGVHTYAEDTVASVTAIPDSGYVFDHWELDASPAGSDNPIDVTMDADHSLTAFFAPPTMVGWIEGTVTDFDTGDPLEGATVSTDAVSDVTDASGFYSLEVSPGTYDVTAEMPGYETQTVTGVIVVADTTTTQDFALVPVAEVGWIEGTVTDADTLLPIAGATVTADAVSDVTDASGYYSLEVSPGTYDVTAEMTGYESQTAIVTIIPDTTVVQDFSLTPVELDITPPTIIINEPTARDYLRSETITLDFTAVDTESGVASISATLDQITVKSGESVELSTLDLGKHILNVTATDNAGNSAAETVEFNITRYAPDLSVSSADISFSDFNPSEGQTITIFATVHNLGEKSAESITVHFYDDIARIGETQISYISHDSYGKASIEWTAEGEGFHLIKIVVDPSNNIIEIDEENNEATRSIQVGEIPHFAGMVVYGSVTPNETRTGCSVTIQGYAEYNTTYGAGEPVAGAEVTIGIIGWGQETTYTIKDGTFNGDIFAPHIPENYTVIVTVTDYTFWETIERGLVITQEVGTDLTLSRHDISFSPFDPIENEIVKITAKIHNVGTDNVSDVLVIFYDDGEPIANRTIHQIPRGESRDTNLSWNATLSGWHTIRVVVDPYNTTAEFNENNNKASKNIWIYPALPDLTPTNIDFSDSTPLVNQTITISANVLNNGGIEARNVLVSFKDGDQSSGNTTIPMIPGKRESRTASINYTFTTSELHVINVTIDIENRIAEADEANNWHCTNIFVHLPSPDLAISSGDITFSKGEPSVGDIIIIYATIRNIGEGDAHDVIVEFFDSGKVIAPPIHIPSISVGGSETVNVSWNATPAGSHVIKVITDGNDTIMESNEFNNVASRYIYVSPLQARAADLCIYSEDIVFSNTFPDPGENVTIYATVHNIGEAEAQDVTVIFHVDNVQLGSPQTILSVPVYQKETVSTKWIASEMGLHVVKIVVDISIDFDKTNNIATRAIIVSSRGCIENMNQTIQDLPDELFISEEDVADVKRDFSDSFNDVIENVDEGRYMDVIVKLNAIKQRIYKEIVECDEREEIISMIRNLIAYLENFL